VFVIKIFYFFGGSFVAVEREYRREFSLLAAPSGDIAYWTAGEFEEAGEREINVRRDINSCVLRFHKVRDLRKHHVEKTF
jgi:hypothetical protein